MNLYLTGGTTSNEQAASDARTSTAPTSQDLQSTIAPQLTTTGSDPTSQPEIPANEAEPAQNLPFIEDWPMNDEISHLVDHDPAVLTETSDLLRALRVIVGRFIYQSGISSPIYEGLKNSKLSQRNTQWIGLLMNPSQ